MPSSAVTVTVRVLAPVCQVTALPLGTSTASPVVPLLVITMEAPASAGVAVTVLVALVVVVV